MKKCLKDIADLQIHQDLSHFNQNDIIVSGMYPSKEILILYNDEFQEPMMV